MGTCLAKVDCKLRKKGGEGTGLRARAETSDQEGGRLGGLEAQLLAIFRAHRVGRAVAYEKGKRLEGIRNV